MAPVYSFSFQVDTVDVTTTWGFIVSEMPSNWDSPVISFPATTIPGVPGEIATTTEPDLAPLDLLFAGNMSLSTSTLLEAAIDGMKYATASKSGCAIIAGNQPNRQRIGYLSSFKLLQLYPSAAQAKVELGIHCRSPLLFATSATTVAGAAATDLACPQGTFWSRPVTTVTFSGSASSVTLTYKNAGGTMVGSALVITHAFVNTDVLVIDHNAMTITLNGSRHDDYLTGGDFFRLDPRDGVLGTTSPSIRTSVGALSIVYTKAYL